MITYEAPVRTAYGRTPEGRTPDGGAPAERTPDGRASEGLALDGLKRRFPGVLIWFGRHTGHFWAMVEVRGVPRLVEAVSAERLAEEIDRCGRPPVW